MKQCTIYSEKDSFTDISSVWQALSYRETEVSSKENNLGGITVKTATGTLELFFKKYKEGGDEFSKMILGTRNYFNQIETTHEEIKSKLLEFISNSNIAIGVTAVPSFTETDERLDIVFGIAEMLDGNIFNGSEMIDKKGRLILDVQGDSECS